MDRAWHRHPVAVRNDGPSIATRFDGAASPIHHRRMGDAKRRGDFETRAALAKAKLDALRPATIVCNGCQRALNEIEQVELRPLKGLDAVFVATCTDCAAETFVVLGTDDAVKTFRAFLARRAAQRG